jgi:proline iminopeptidase
MTDGRLVPLPDTRLYVVTRGAGPVPVLVLHGGPGLDHTEFGAWLDALGDVATLHLVDQRGQGRSDPEDPQALSVGRFAQDVTALARALELERYVVLGHSYGAFVALRHAVEGDPGALAGTIVSAGIPAQRFMAGVPAALAAFEPEDLRASVAASWEREADARTVDDVHAIMADQLPFHFADPRDPRIADVLQAMQAGRPSPDVLRWSADADGDELDLEDRLPAVTVPALVLAGRHDHVTTLEASEAIARGIPQARLVVFEHSAHFAFVEETDAYVAAVRDWLATLG